MLLIAISQFHLYKTVAINAGSWELMVVFNPLLNLCVELLFTAIYPMAKNGGTTYNTHPA